jgi:hypothetical protein
MGWTELVTLKMEGRKNLQNRSPLNFCKNKNIKNSSVILRLRNSSVILPAMAKKN